MDVRSVLRFLLLICTINAAFFIHNGQSASNNIRRVRRISEYLVPPSPPPRFRLSGRIPRLANYQPVRESGYFEKFMNWLNPFYWRQPPSQSLPKTPYPQKSIQTISPATAYTNPSVVIYEKPPPSPPTTNNHMEHSDPTKTKNCNLCNKAPWMPIQQDKLIHSEDNLYTPPPSSTLFKLQYNDEYPSKNQEISYDAYQAASEEIRTPDFAFIPPHLDKQEESFLLPNPHLYPGAMPPLYKAKNFNPQVISNEDSGYHVTSLPSSFDNNTPTEDDLFFNATKLVFKNEHNGQFLYPSTFDTEISSQQLEYIHDLSSSGTQISRDHIYPTLNKQELESNNKNLYNFTNHPTLLGSPSDISSQSSEIFNEGNYNATKLSKPTDSFLDNTSQTGFLNSFKFSSLNHILNGYRHNNQSLNTNIAKSPLVPSHTSDSSSTKTKDSINFEESPLLDFTLKGESRPHLPSTSNAYEDFESTESTGSVIASGDEIFETRQGETTSTKSNFSVDYFETTTMAKKPEINFSSSLDKVKDILSQYDNIKLHTSSEKRNEKRHKQVQVIIPYTSQYTPLPFHSTREKKISDSHDLNYDSYVGEESRNRINVVKSPNSSVIFQPTTSPMFENATKELPNTRTNNSIAVHKLQKNIDNWTIQNYTKGMLGATISSMYWTKLHFPTKTIPEDYFTTPKSAHDKAHSYNDNVKSFTLSGFSFNNQEYEGSASHRKEGPQIQAIKNKNLTKNFVNASDKNTWQNFPVGISSVNKERVYIVTPEPQSNINNQKREQKALTKAESNTKNTLQADTEDVKNSDVFESIEKAYQVLPQAVNNLAVASTGPENVRLWGIMEHEDFTSSVNNEYDNNDTESPVLYSKFSKESRARR